MATRRAPRALLILAAIALLAVVAAVLLIGVAEGVSGRSRGSIR